MRRGAVLCLSLAVLAVAGAARAQMPPTPTFEPVFEPCAHCHQIGPGARITTGPPLTGVLGRRAGSLPRYPFSDAMRSSGIVWDRAVLARFIAAPQAVVPGTRMVFAGLDDAAQVQALVAFVAAQGTPGR